MEKLWGSRFKKKTHYLVERFTSSIDYDYKLAGYDVLASIAHAKMLGKCGIISRQDSARIVQGLQSILKEVETGRFHFDKKAEDIHTDIQNALQKKIGKTAEKLHTARSRNDQVATDLRMYVREEIAESKIQIAKLQKELVHFAGRNIKVIIPGLTHLQHAQPVLLAHHLLAYVEMLERDKDRLTDAAKRCDVLPLGSGALAGTSLPIDRNYTARLLGFSKVCANSMDAVSDRDFVLEVLSDLAVLSMHLSRMAEDFILWTGTEFAVLELDDAFATGSSLMPQKKNPDVLELIRAESGTIYGNLFAFLTTMKGLALAYNRDMQLDKLPLFGSLEKLNQSLDILAELIKTARVRQSQAIILSCDELLYATDLAEYLVKKGLAFKQAHNIVGKAVAFSLQKKIFLSEISLSQWKRFSPYFDKDVYKLLDAQYSVAAKKSFGGTSPLKVRAQIKSWQKRLQER